MYIAKYTINPTGMNKFLWTSKEKTIAILFIGQIHEEAWELGIDSELYIFSVASSWQSKGPNPPKATFTPQEIASPNKVIIKGNQWFIVP